MTSAHTPRSPRAAAAKLRAVPDSAPETAPPRERRPRSDGWSLDMQAAFLRALSATHSVSEAAQSVGRSRQAAYRLRSRLKGQAFDLAWEVAFHHSFDVLAHAALERALNGVERPVFYKGEQVGSYRRYDESLTRALLRSSTMGGNPVFGRLKPMAERHARDFESLLAKIASGATVATGALTPEDPDEFGHSEDFARENFCPSGWSDDELMRTLQENGWKKEK
ncbi:hypothetical protein [Erythrobacter donghaensis]|uniref:hypothetical protein n=1 Tax=Erythrobacter donghaensis TaxID=267135 RepID=UPI000A36145D|nr:hypothetical protein [Erythrobacter donghaensis]